MALWDNDATRNQILTAIGDKEQPIPSDPMSTDQVYKSEYYRADTGERRELRFVVKIDRHSNLVTDYCLIKGDGVMRKRIDQTGHQTDLTEDELDPRLKEG